MLNRPPLGSSGGIFYILKSLQGQFGIMNWQSLYATHKCGGAEIMTFHGSLSAPLW